MAKYAFVLLLLAALLGVGVLWLNEGPSATQAEHEAKQAQDKLSREEQRLQKREERRAMLEAKRADALRLAAEEAKEAKETEPEGESEKAQVPDGRPPVSFELKGEGVSVMEAITNKGKAKPSTEEQADDKIKVEGTFTDAKTKKEYEGIKDLAARIRPAKRVNLGIRGRVTRANFNRLSGYLYDLIERESEMEVIVFVDGVEKHTIKAETREKHKTLGVIWRFDLKKPDSLLDRKAHELRFYGVSSSRVGRTELVSSPRRLLENNYAKGRLEACSKEDGLNGYAFDWDHSKEAIEVVFHLDGQEVGRTTAKRKNKLYRKKRYTPTENNAFKHEWFVPEDSASHIVQAFALDPDTDELVELDGSPRAIQGSRDGVNRPPEGRLDIVNKNVISGWTWDPDHPDASINVEIWMDGKRLTSMIASSPRQTLVSSKTTKSPNHGFAIAPPIEMLDGKAHQIRVYGIDQSSGVSVELANSKRLYRVTENESPIGGFWRADEKMLRGWAADPDLGQDAAELAIYIDGKLWKTQKAERPETFIEQAGYAPNKEHGFLIVPPEVVKDGQEHEVEIFVHNYPEGPSKSLGKRTIGVKSIFPGFWTSDRELDSRAPQGLYITSVSPWYNAYHQGILKGDVLLTFGGVKYTKTSTFRKELTEKYKKNELVEMTFWRDGENMSVKVKVGEIIGR